MLLVTVASVHTVKASFNVLFALNKKLMYCVCVRERGGGGLNGLSARTFTVVDFTPLDCKNNNM